MSPRKRGDDRAIREEPMPATTTNTEPQEPGIKKPVIWLAEHLAETKEQHSRWRARESRWAWVRLFSFAAAVLVWWPAGAALWLAAPLSVAGLILFIHAVQQHRRARLRREAADRLLVMITESEKRCCGQVALIRAWQRPEDPSESDAALEPIVESGKTWPLTEQEQDDLDLYARPVGIFGLLNRCSTAPGARRLRDLLDRPMLAAERIEVRQETVRWLSEHPAERLRLMAAAAVLRGEDARLDQLALNVRRATPLPGWILSKYMRWWTLPSALITLACLVSLATAHFGAIYGLGVLLLVNGSVFLRVQRELRARLDPWRNLTRTAKGYLLVARQAVECLPMHGELGRLRKTFQAVRRPMVLPALCGRLPWADTGGLIHALTNALFFYDLHLAEAILTIVVRHRDALLQGLSAVADIEALLSLATFAWEQPDKCFPQVVGTPGVWISAGRHPLIPPERVVPNDVRLSPASRLWVISGSNMAGKSTLLRVTGVNAVLAQIGTVATAGEMVLRPVRLITDLQARDSLPDQESYFLAEVRHVRRMVLPPEDAEPALGLIDEPFRGTNSDERVAASLAVVQHLLNSRDFFLVATHEPRLTELVNGTTGRNYHFRENLSEEGLVFDYRLHPGPARTRNALRVLEREGYPLEILDRARDWAGRDEREDTRPP
jgi:hypothetical protein